MSINQNFPLQDCINIETFSAIMSSLNITGEIKVGVAVSGGSDSLCLAILLSQWSKINGVKIVALIVNHRLRDNIETEIQQTIKWLNFYSIDTKILTIDKLNTISKIQQNARHARYKALLDYCVSNNICYLCVAHTFNDLIETIHMRKQRKNNIVGLSGIAFVKNYKQVLIFRPLLFFTKTAIQTTLQNLQQSWIEDPSNQDIKFERVLIRNKLGKLSKKQLVEYFNIYNNLRNNRIILEKNTLKFFIEHVVINNFGVIEFNLNTLLPLKEELKLHLLRILISFCANKTYMPKIDKIKTLLELLNIILQKKKTQKFTVGGVLLNLMQNNKLILIKEARSINDCKALRTTENIIWDNRFLIKNLHEFPEKYFFANLSTKEYNIFNKNKIFKEILSNFNLTKEVILSLPWLFDIQKKPVFNWIYKLLDRNYIQFFPEKSLLQDLFWNFSIDKLYHLD